MFEMALEEARARYGMLVFGYVVMPEHVHLLVSEPERELLSTGGWPGQRISHLGAPR
jgi:putative transposase